MYQVIVNHLIIINHSTALEEELKVIKVRNNDLSTIMYINKSELNNINMALRSTDLCRENIITAYCVWPFKLN